MTADVARFEPHRAELLRHAYRMLGERAEAEDAVQDAYERWHAATSRTAIADDRAFLRTTVTRLCVDRLRSARARREVYVGPWLPEPLVSGGNDPAAASELADDVSFALLLALERLSPLERAAFLLHDVMDVPFAEIAQTLDRSEDAVKQLASRARTHVREPRVRRTRDRAEALLLRDRFAIAFASGDLPSIQRLLTDDVVLLSDGGGKRSAAIVPLSGIDRVGRMLEGIRKKAPPDIEVTFAIVNDDVGFVLRSEGTVFQTLSLEVRDGKIGAIYIVRNPDKLGETTAMTLAE